MTRLSTRYWTRRTLLQVSCDLSLIVVLFLAAWLVSPDLGRPHAVPAAPGISLLCGLLLINTASGLYGTVRERSPYQFMRGRTSGRTNASSRRQAVATVAPIFAGNRALAERPPQARGSGVDLTLPTSPA